MPRRGRFAMRIRRDGVVRVVEHLQVRDHVLDLGALVELRAADHLVGDALAHEHVLEHAALRVRAVDDGDLARAVALLDQARDLGGDEARLGVLVLGLDDAHRLALAEVRPEVLLLAVAVVRDDVVGDLQDRVRRAVVLLERDHLRVREVAFELEDVADVCASEGVDRLVRVPDRHQVLVISTRAAAAARTARGSCPGTRRPSRSGTTSPTSRAPRGSAAGRRRSASACRRSRRRSRRRACAGRASRRRRRSGRRSSRHATRTRPGRSAGSWRSRSASGCRAARSASGRARAPPGTA